MKKGKGHRSDDTMDEEYEDKDTKRKSRNLSEKKRRDQFNLLLNELSSMVSSGGRKMDKSTVLKSTISFLKHHNEIAVRSRAHEIQEDWKPSFLTNEEFTHLVLDAVDGFIIVFSVSGHILYASDNITTLLGYLPNDVLNTTIYEMATEKEHNSLYNVLFTPDQKGQISFSCYLKRGDSDLSQRTYFELVHLIGYFKSDPSDDQSDSRYNGYSEGETRQLFVGTARLQTSQILKEISLKDSSKNEFSSRHSLEWKFLFLDHRASSIIGYLPFELLGTSGYDYYHVDDLDEVIKGHKALMVKGEGTSCYYRFLTKGEQWIWLQTRFYITYHQWNSKPEFIVCTHQVMSDMTREPKDHSESEQVEAPTSSWCNRFGASKFDNDMYSDCTSLSAESPGSIRYYNSDSSQTHQYVEQPHYVAVIPMKPVITSHPDVEVRKQRADLQRKHAELRASIDQQQAELMAVSEQLFMTQLELLHPPTQHPQVSTSYTYNQPNPLPSTAVSKMSIAIDESLPAVVQNVTVSASELNSSDILYSPTGSSTSLNLIELK
ncbi:circadian locomoter output cycles protein kaput isoform X2 [Photinus pyralis]|uniref:Circadian locomoter output cycles protein kaput n=2 Tax=Photinus pyralis TaxID=7054 RepID=A0A1Y1M421_PHOPY|nr:circadian locomoter output cycles protein kaput isoform X2 [Photinus pyralis]